VLLEIKDLLDNPERLAKDDKLRLAAALAALGDDEGALEVYSNIETEVVLSTEANKEETIRIFALRMLTAARLNLPETENMAAYLAEHDSKEQTVVLELMMFLRYYRPYAEGIAVLEHSGGQRIALDRYRGTTLRFGREQLEKADFKPAEGDITGFYFYTGTITDLENNPHMYKTPSLSMKKTVIPVDGEGIGALYEVKLEVVANSAPGFYSFEDMIPSGARFAGSKDNGMVTRSGQRVSAMISYVREAEYTRSVSYYIRWAIPGEYVQEPTVVYDDFGNWGITERGTLIVSAE
jgi:hypothetical protein